MMDQVARLRGIDGWWKIAAVLTKQTAVAA
jgi:hypothetical protein